MSGFSSSSQLQNDLQIANPHSNNGPMPAFPLLDVHVLDAVNEESAAFPGESERNRDLCESSSVNVRLE